MYVLISPAVLRTKSGGGCPIQTSFGAFETTSGTSATCACGLHRKPWRTSCRKAGVTEWLEQESKTPRVNQLGNFCRHTTPEPSAPQQKCSIDWGSWYTESVTRGTSLRRTSSSRRRLSAARATHKERRIQRGLANARQRSQSGPGATAFSRAGPIDST